MEILGLIDVPLWLILVLGFLLLIYVYVKRSYSVWSSQGVPGPKPWPFMGNTLELREKSGFNVFGEWHKKYGRVVGYYTGVNPVLAISDLDMVREVMVRQFNNFHERNMIRGMRPPIFDKTVFFAYGSAWKRIRSLVTPAFSTTKLKLMSRYVNRCCGLLVDNIEQKARAGQLIDVKDVFQAFTLDVIAGTGFGLDTNSQTQEEEPFIVNCKKLFSNIGFKGIIRYIFFLVQACPRLAPLMRVSGFGRNTQFFYVAMEQLVDERLEEKKQPKQNSKRVPDMLQLMVDAEADESLIADTANGTDDTKSYRRLTKEEIISQGFILLIAGFETTATTLQYLTYNLAMHPDVQQRILEEIEEQLGEAQPTYENVNQLKYLEATIRETLRQFPPLSFVDRKAEQAVTIKGVNIPAGCGVTIPIYSILHDPEYFPDPERFNPDRFLDENSSDMNAVVAELPFGYGPRKCIGMRLALLEIKMAAALMVRKVHFDKCAETPDKVILGKAINLAVPDSVIKVKAELRSP